MGTYTFKLPDIGEGIAEAEIAEWKVAVGDDVAEDQELVDMLTDKAAVAIESPVAGKVTALKGNAGDMVAVGGPLVVLEVEGDGNTIDETADDAADDTADNTAAAKDEDEPTPTDSPSASDSEDVAPKTAKSKPGSPDSAETTRATAATRDASAAGSSSTARAQRTLPRAPGERPLASPAVRKRANELGVRLAYVSGTGPAGRITHADLDGFVAAGGSAVGGGTARAPKPGTEAIRIIGLRRKIAEAMQQAKQRIPHFAYVEEVDVTELEALRTHLNATRRDDQAKLTLLPFLTRALVIAIPDFPQANARYDDEAGVLNRYDALHVGIATQTPQGLVVPVVRHAEAMSIWEIAAEVRRLADAARSGKANREELAGSTITITSLGAMGGIASTPVINAPEVGIIGVNKMVTRPMWMNGGVVPRQMMNLSSSFDHRIVDGADAAALIQRIKGLLEHPASLFMGDEA